MKKKIISVITIFCLCLWLVSSFFVFWNEVRWRNIQKKVQKVKFFSQDKTGKIKITQSKKSSKKIFSDTNKKTFVVPSIWSNKTQKLWENIDQYFYGKNFYFMLFWVIKNIN